MKNILRQIADILYNVPNMNADCMCSIMHPIETVEQANKMLEYLKNNQESLKTGYLIKHKYEIVGI